MKQKTDDLLYRSFLVDLLTQKLISNVSGRNVKSQKIKFLEREYKSIYKTDPKNDFTSVKDKYNSDEMSYVNIYALRITKDKKGRVKAVKYNHGGYTNVLWRGLRLEVFKRDNNTCEKCLSNKELNCHHNYYISGRKLWEYPLSCFSTLCRTCHEEFHKKIKGTQLVIRNKKLLAEKIEEERLNGFIHEVKNIEVKSIKRQPKVKKTKYFSKSKYVKSIIKERKEAKKDQPETLQQRRSRLVVPQWKIDEYRRSKV